MILLVLLAAWQEPPAKLYWFDDSRDSLGIDFAREVPREILDNAENYSIKALDRRGRAVFSGSPLKAAGSNDRKTVRLELKGKPDRWERVRVTFAKVLADAAGPKESSELVEPGAPGVALMRLGAFRPAVEIDFRTSEGEDKLGVDYRVHLLRLDAVRWGDGETGRVALNARSEGYLKLGQLSGAGAGDQDLNAVHSQFDLEYALAAGVDPDGSTLASFFKVDLHAGHESDQEFEATEYVYGGGAAGLLGFLVPRELFEYNFLDMAERPRPIRAPRVYAGIEEVTGAEDTGRASRTGEDSDSFARLKLEAAWSLPVLWEGSRISVLWRGYYDFEADRNPFTQLVEAALRVDLTALFGGEAGEKPPISYRFVVKYVGGRLPPDYSDEHQASAGVSIDF